MGSACASAANKNIKSGKIIKEADGEFSVTVAHERYDAKFPDTVEGCWNLFYDAVAMYSNSKCMAFLDDGKYKFYSFKQVLDMVEQTAYGLNSFNLGEERNVGIQAKNSPGWMLSCLACWRQGCKVVPFYDTLGEEAMLYILELTSVVVLFTESSKIASILKIVRSNREIVKLETIVVIDSTNIIGDDADAQGENKPPFVLSSSMEEELKLMDLTLIKLSEFKYSKCAAIPESGDDIAIIMFTSGTTGKPKGVLLSHSNIATSMYSNTRMLKEYPGLQTLRHYSYLPLAHIFELAVETTMLSSGGCIYYSSGDIKKLKFELPLVKPTMFFGVPRVYQKFYDGEMLKANEGVQGKLLSAALSEDGCLSRCTLRQFYNIILRKVCRKMGLSECKLFVSGAAPLPEYQHKFLQTLVPGVYVAQGYGMTETTACGSAVRPHDSTGGHVGGPTLVNFLKLRDVPEMGRTHKNNPPDGEILIGGPPVFKGYYKNSEQTKETLLEGSDGTMWVATGDIGVMCANNSIRIVDRKKNIFKLSQGEYIAVEKIEMEYSKCAALNQIWVYGNSYKTCVVAVVSPSLPQVFEQEFFVKKSDVDPLDAKAAGPIYTEWIKSEKNREMLTKACYAEMKAYEGCLKGFEKVRAIFLDSYMNERGESFTIENNLLTPSMKLMRPKLKAHYLNDLQNMYSGLGMAPQEGENW